MSARSFLEWAESPAGRAFYTAHPTMLEPEDMRMLMAFSRLGGQCNSIFGIAREVERWMQSGHSNCARYLLSLLTAAELHELRGYSWIIKDVRRRSEFEALVAATQPVEWTAPAVPPIHVVDGVRQVRLAHELPLWTAAEYKAWCASEEGRIFYWLPRRGKYSGPSEFTGDADTPEEMATAMEALRAEYRTNAPEYIDPSDEVFIGHMAHDIPKSQCMSQHAPVHLFRFLQKHEPHPVSTHYPQTFLYAVSLLTPLELDRARSFIKGDPRVWGSAGNPHPNAITNRHLHSPEVQQLIQDTSRSQFNAEGQRARSALEQSGLGAKILVEGGGADVADLITRMAVPGPFAHRIPVPESRVQAFLVSREAARTELLAIAAAAAHVPASLAEAQAHSQRLASRVHRLADALSEQDAKRLKK